MLKSGYKTQKIIESIDIKKHNITKKTIPLKCGDVHILYIKQLTDMDKLTKLIVRPLVEYAQNEHDKVLGATAATGNVFYTADCEVHEEEDMILEYILTGMVVVLFPADKKYAVINLKNVEKRSVPTPEIEYSLRAPKECFNENLDTNLSLLRNRIKDEHLRIKTFKVGRRTKTSVAVIYIEDIANEMSVNEITKRIEKINVDGIYESGELQAFLLNKKSNLFPQMGMIERVDMAGRMLLDGRIVILVEGSGLAIYAPITFGEFMYACDDFYDNKYFGAFMRVIRYISLFFALCGSSIFVAITSFHTEVLPSSYTILLAELRSNVPFTAILGALILEFMMEVIRESLLRVPKQIGPAIGIVGAIVIGQAATAAGIFSPVLLIIASVALISSFVIPDMTLIHPFRILKFLLIIATGIFGFYGVMLAICAMLINLVSINSFGVPYMAPMAPFNLYDFLRLFVSSKTLSPYRTKFLRTKDKKITDEEE